MKEKAEKSIFIYGTIYQKNESGQDFQRDQIWNDRSQYNKKEDHATSYNRLSVFFSRRFVVCRFCTGWQLLDIKGDKQSILFSSQE